jgi:hypothetical protein
MRHVTGSDIASRAGMEDRSDERLLEAVVGGDMDALTILVERYQQALTGYLDQVP